MELEVKVRGVKQHIDKAIIQEEVIKYYDCTGIKHFYEDVEKMNDDELIALYENSFARE